MGKFERPRKEQELLEPEKSGPKNVETGYKQNSSPKKTIADKIASTDHHKIPKKMWIIGCICAALVLIGSGIGSWYYFCFTGDDGRILNNVYAAGVNIGGMTPKEAADVLKFNTEHTYTQENMIITLPDRDIKLLPSDTNAHLDVDAAVKAAYQYGRTGTSAQQRKMRRQAVKSDYTLDLIPYLNLNLDYIQEITNQIGAQYNSQLTPPKVTISGNRPSLNPEDINNPVEHQVMTITLGAPESALDVTGLYGMIIDAYSVNKFSVHLDFSIVQPELPDLEKLFKKYCAAPVDAKLDAKNYEIIPEIYGYGFDIKEVQNLLNSAKHNETVTVTLKYLAPEVTEKTITDSWFKDLLSTATAYEACSENRMINLKLASETVNGIILKPGEVFSFNEIVGDTTEEKGYKGAGAYLNGQSVTSIGGGICQVSTCLYNAALLADMQIVERYNHIYPSSYADLGLDATISWGTLDLKFKNNTQHPMRIDAAAEGGRVTVKFYGTDEKNYYIKMTNEITKNYPFSVIYKEYPESNPDNYQDGDIIQTGYTGFDVNTYRCKYDKLTNTLISKTLEDKSDYSKRDKIVCTIKVPETTVPPETTLPVDPSEPDDGFEGVVSK